MGCWQSPSIKSTVLHNVSLNVDAIHLQRPQEQEVGVLREQLAVWAVKVSET